jgi:hypothetical protein
METRPAIAWSWHATTGAIALADGLLTGDLARGLLACRLSPAGKFRNGAARWWCASHQCHWGVQADLARGDGTCRGAAVAWVVAVDPLVVDGPLRLALAGDGIVLEDGALVPALRVRVAPGSVFAQLAITQVNITPPALAGLASADGCIDCARCGYPHLDLGAFARKGHRRHTCGHCGHDGTHSGAAIVSNPLFALVRKGLLNVDVGR